MYGDWCQIPHLKTRNFSLKNRNLCNIYDKTLQTNLIELDCEKELSLCIKNSNLYPFLYF